MSYCIALHMYYSCKSACRVVVLGCRSECVDLYGTVSLRTANSLVRYFTAMQWCLYDLVSAICGHDAAAEHVRYNIILWQPPVTAFYCDLGIYVFYSSAS